MPRQSCLPDCHLSAWRATVSPQCPPSVPPDIPATLLPTVFTTGRARSMQAPRQSEHLVTGRESRHLVASLNSWQAAPYHTAIICRWGLSRFGRWPSAGLLLTAWLAPIFTALLPCLYSPAGNKAPRWDTASLVSPDFRLWFFWRRTACDPPMMSDRLWLKGTARCQELGYRASTVVERTLNLFLCGWYPAMYRRTHTS